MESWMRKLLAPKNMLFFCTQYVSFKHTFHCHTYEYKKNITYLCRRIATNKQWRWEWVEKNRTDFLSYFFHIFFFVCSFKDWWCFCFTTHLSANLCLREMLFFSAPLMPCTHKKWEPREKCWKKFMTLCSLHCDSYDT